MKTLKMLKSLAVMMALSFSVQSLAVPMTEVQKAELYNSGTITTADGVFEVKFMPGKENILKNAKGAWSSIEQNLNNMVDMEKFWYKKVVRRLFDGLEFASDCVTEGVCAIPGEFCKTCEKNDKIKDGFGSSIQKVHNWLKFCAVCVEKVCVTTFGVPAGVIYGVAYSGATVLWQPVAAATKAVVAGTVYPSLLAYNWTAYKLVENKETPEQGDFTVTYIPNKFHEEDFHPEVAQQTEAAPVQEAGL